MTLVSWNEKNNCLNTDKVQSEHLEIFTTINKLFDAIKNTAHNLDELLTELYRLKENHFKSEEQYFVTLTKKDAELHRLQHCFILELLENIKPDKNTFTFEQLYDIADYFMQHINEEDAKLEIKPLNEEFCLER